MIRFPRPLVRGDLIAVTAPSSGVSGGAVARLDLVLDHLRACGFRVVEGACLRTQSKDASAPADERAAELMKFLLDPTVAAVMPPWGGERAIELLERLDGSAQAIAFRGYLIGGCMDTLFRLAGTRYGDVPAFVRASGSDGAILYLENAEMKPCELLRGLWGARMNGWFGGLAGLLIGRSAAPDKAGTDSLTYLEALTAVLGDLSCPILIDVDIGHQQPQFTLINGAYAEVVFDGSGGRLTQWRDARLAEAT